MRTVFRLGVAVALGALCVQASFADEPEEIFEALYGQAYRQAKASRHLSDDVALAGKVLAMVKQKEFRSEAIPLFCQKVYELGSQHTKGCETAIEAMDLLARRFPEHRVAALAKIVGAREQLFNASRGPQKLQAGRSLVAGLLDSAEAEFDAGKDDEAAGATRRALKLAKQLAPGRYEDIQVRIHQLDARRNARKEAAGLEARLKSDPADTAARTGLIHLYLVALDDPAAAARFVDESCEVDVRKHVPAAAKSLEDAPRLACLEMGSWYGRLAEAETEPGTVRRLLRRAWAYYRRHSELHKDVDVERGRAVQAMREVLRLIFETRLDGLGKTHAMDARGKRFAELLALHGADRWVRGWAQLKGGVLTMPARISCDTSLRCKLEGGYQVITRLAWAKPTISLGLMLPVGFDMVGAEIQGEGQRCGLVSVDGGDLLRVPDPLAASTAYEMEVVVLPTGGRAEVFMAIDGAACLYWEGPQFGIVPPSHPDMGYHRWGGAGARFTPGCVTLHACGTEVITRSVRLRMLSGAATPITVP